MNAIDEIYSGSAATASEVLVLANEYRRSAAVLFENAAKPRKQLSRAPARLCAIQAIELFLNAFLLHAGESPEKIRSNHHNLADRLCPEKKKTIEHLKKLTHDHLVQLTEAKEYVVTRYGPELTTTLSQINRLMATLDEVAKKVTKCLECAPKEKT